MLHPLSWKKKKQTQEERWRKIRDIEWWCQESRGTFVQCLPSFQESQRGYLLSTEGCHDFMNLENMGIVLNSCAGEVGCLGDLTHHLGLSCPVWGPMPPSEPYSSSYKSQSGMTNVQHMCHAPRLPQADDRHYESSMTSFLTELRQSLKIFFLTVPQAAVTDWSRRYLRWNLVTIFEQSTSLAVDLIYP